MNKPMKIFLLIVAGFVFLTLSLAAAGLVMARSAGWLLNEALESDPTDIHEIGRAIADYDVPEGFIDAYAVEVAGFKLVSYRHAEKPFHMALIQAPESMTVDLAELERQVRASTGTDEVIDVKVEEYIPYTIRGEETVVIHNSGLSRKSHLYHSATAIFKGNGGTALVNFAGPAEAWDMETVETFLKSLR